MRKDELIKTVIELHHAVIGNGTKGLGERVSDLEKEVKNLNKHLYLLVSGGFVVLLLIEIFK